MEYLNKRLIRVASCTEPADLVIRGGQLLDVYSGTLGPGDLAIADGRIAASGDVTGCVGPATETLDAEGSVLAPGLIDAHLHAEVPKITLTNLANAVVARGTTSIMTPLDQLGVVVGVEGMRWVLDEARRTPLEVFHSGPSRLPYTTPASTVGRTFGPAEHRICQQWPEAVGIWEYMADSVLDFDEAVYEVAEMTVANRLGLHGHAPVTTGRALTACAAAGMRDDHESYSAEEVREKLSKGIKGILRRGTHTDNLPEGVRAILELGLPARHFCLCTDDLDCQDIVDLGLVDYLVRYAIELGLDPVTALQMATLNAAELYRVDHLVGSLAPGRIANVLLIDDLPRLDIRAVVAKGRLVAREGELVSPTRSPAYPDSFRNTMRLERPITADDLALAVESGARQADVLCLHVDLEEGLLSRRRDAVLTVNNGRIEPDPSQDVLYITVTDRYTGKGLTGRGFISGFGLKEGAIATSLSPDDNNIICVGASLADMAVAINHLVALEGGQVAVRDGNVVADMPLPLCGFMADVSAEAMSAMEKRLNEAAYGLGTRLKRPFFFLIFLSITAIPEYAVTDRGVVAHASRTVINPIRGCR